MPMEEGFHADPPTPSQPLPLHKGKGECDPTPTSPRNGERRMPGTQKLAESRSIAETFHKRADTRVCPY